MLPTTPPPQPPSIRVIGWSTIFASGIMIIVNIFGLFTYANFDSMKLDLEGGLLSQIVPQSMKRVMDLYSYNRWWTWYGIFYFLFVLFAAFQFAKLRAWGRSALEAACWIGLLNAVIDCTLSYLIWKNTQEALAMALRGVGGGQYGYLNPLGLAAIVVGLFLWIIPSAGMILYLRSTKIRLAVSLP